VPNTHDRLADGRRADPADDRLERIRETIRFLGHIMSGWSGTADDGPPDVGAGLGSSVVVDDIDTGARETYVLMTGALLDIDGGQVSLASPIGQALLGVTGGEVVTVATPQRTRRLRVLSVRTLRDLLDDDLVAAPAATW
jgi:transcription elongation factor GreA